MSQSESTVLYLLAARWPNSKRSGQTTKKKKNYMEVSDRYSESCPTTCPESEKTKISTFNALLTCMTSDPRSHGGFCAGSYSELKLEGHERHSHDLVSAEESGLCCPLPPAEHPT